jgi:copper chaperone
MTSSADSSISCVGSTRPPQRIPSATDRVGTARDMTSAQWVQGMSEEAGAIPGVTDVSVDLQTGAADDQEPAPAEAVQAAIDEAGYMLTRRRRRIVTDTIAATRQRPAPPNQARVYWPVVSRTIPAAAEATAAPNWCEANTQPNTIVPDVPNASRHSAAVGGTVATQSSP